jgi:hypothetical protein
VVVMMRTYFALLPLFALSQLACGGADEGRPSGETSGDLAGESDQCELAEGYEFQDLVNFDEITNDTGDRVRTGECEPSLGLDCSFYMNYDLETSPENEKLWVNDETREVEPQYLRGEDCEELLVGKDAKVFTQPEVKSNQPTGELLEGGRCGEEVSALHIITRNVGMCIGSDGRTGWGAAFDITFGGLDASEWDGVSFWVKQGPGAKKPAIIVQFVDSIVEGGREDNENETFCDSSDSSTVLDSEKCDSFGTAVTLTDDWSFVPARFDSLRQKGFGAVSPLGHLKVEEIIRMQVLMDAGDADFYIDDIALFRDK